MNKATDFGPWLQLLTMVDESQRRLLAAVKAIEIGWGGIVSVSKMTGLSQTTIIRGIKELKDPQYRYHYRIRKPGGGRKKVEERYPDILDVLEEIMNENTAGDPMSLLKWTNKSTYKIADELVRRGYQIGSDTVGRLLKEMNYTLQANVKKKEGGTSPERDAQFRYINQKVKEFISRGDPVISVDTKKRELVGEFKNPGRAWRKKDNPKEVNVYDFPSLGIGVAIPYGIFDEQKNEGLVNVGISYDTSEFAVESIHQWWDLLGIKHYQDANELLICADGGGSNGSRRRGWKYYLYELACQIDKKITVCHFPPGTSKWNKIEHCMFSFISMNWRGEPLINYEVVINLISSTKTKGDLKVAGQLDERAYEKGQKFSDDLMATIKIESHEVHPKWNYTLLPIK